MPEDPHELRDAALTYLPATLVAFTLHWLLTERRGWESRPALMAGVGVGIVLAILLQRALRRR